MYAIDLDSLELRDVVSELEPDRRARVAFPHHSAVGNASTATVYFELEPGSRVGAHTDSAEELLLILEGEAETTVGQERARAGAGTLLTVPAMEPACCASSGSSPHPPSSRPSRRRSRPVVRRCSSSEPRFR